MTTIATRLLALALVTLIAGSAAAGDAKTQPAEEGSSPSLHRIDEAHAVFYARAEAFPEDSPADSFQGEVDPDWLAWTAAMDECLETGLTEEECIEIVSPIVFAACLATARAKKNACLDKVIEDYDDGLIGSTYAGEVACELHYDADIMGCMNLL